MPDFSQELIELLPRLRRFALGLTKSSPDAEDLVQAAVERALRHADAWQQGTRLDSWMYRIIQNLWRDELRSQRRKSEPLDATLELAGEDGQDSLSQNVEIENARAALLQLPEQQRAVFTVVVLDGMSYLDAAAALEIPVGTVMSRLARARASLAASVGHEARRVKVVK